MKHQLSISSTETIAEVQKRFNKMYPFLKIEFFSKPHIHGQGSHKKDMLTSRTPMNQIMGNIKKMVLTFNDDCSISEFENLVQHQTGLNIQVFRKSGKIWLETSATDNWTLKQQNEEGKSLAQHFKTEVENPDDHDVY
jgi:G3E family GTPase